MSKDKTPNKRVIIKRCTMGTAKNPAWYKDKIGKEYKVYEGTMHYYATKDGKVKPIRKIDAKLI